MYPAHMCALTICLVLAAFRPYKKGITLTNGAGTTGHPHEKEMNLNIELMSFAKIKSKWIRQYTFHHPV